MKVSRAELATRSEERVREQQRTHATSRNAELVLLIAASVFIATGLRLVYLAKTHDLAAAENSTLNLNQLTGPQQLIPSLGMIAAPADRDFIANRM